jgi:alpha-ketoglutarate-dependent sulfate ester dioxygenase
MTASQVKIRKLTARIGAEVSGPDLTAPLDDETVRQIRAALNEHKALVFRNTGLDEAGQARFARYFGELTKAHPTLPARDGSPASLPVDSEQGVSNRWHTDVTFVLNPPQASTLRSVIVPPYGGETLIATTAGAYHDLPEQLKLLAETLRAEHTNHYDYSVMNSADPELAERRKASFLSASFRTEHPVVRVHPLTRERGLFIGAFAGKIVGLSTTESRDIIRTLQAYVTRPENVVRIPWEQDQLVLFDNRITQHYAVDNYDAQPRKLNRITIAGDVPVGLNGEPSRAIAGDASDYSSIATVAA